MIAARLIFGSAGALALIVAWRTWVHANRCLQGRSDGWDAVVEAGLGALVVALLFLASAIVSSPRQAPPYVIAYAGGALINRLMLGVVLRTTARLVLRQYD